MNRAIPPRVVCRCRYVGEGDAPLIAEFLY
jgi:hypothetical protein